jgi:hypothetical protein
VTIPSIVGEPVDAVRNQHTDTLPQ